MRDNKRFANNLAVAGVIEALLMVALIAIVISLIQLIYIPQVMEQREAEHMDAVSNQFSQLKSVIDTQALLGSMEVDAPLEYVPMTSQITMGSDALPYFVSIPSSGQLSIVEEDDVKITIFPPPGDFPVNGLTLGSIVYDANNHYFVEQTYAFEGGGIILNQPEGEHMSVDPSISVENESTKIIINYYLPKIIGIPGKTTHSSYDEGFIRTNYSSYKTYNAENITYLRINTTYLDAWNHSLNQNDTGILWEYVDRGYITFTKDEVGPPPSVEIRPNGKNLWIRLTVVNIYAQIGPGWLDVE